VRTSSAPSQRHWALAALGLTRLPLFAVARDFAAGDLVRVLPECRFEGPSLYAMYLADRYRPAAAKALLADVIAELGDPNDSKDRKS
jgi:DNA-binding transcriptional LysR family regulator